MEENIIKVVHCKTKDIFNQRFAEINVSPEEKDENPYYYYVIIIQDTGEVYTHGKIINSDTLNKLKTLIGNDSDKSARKIAEEEISKVIDNAPEMYDTLQEIAAWIEEHGDEVTEINNGITTNAQNISTISKHIAWNATDIIPNYKYYITKSEFIAEYPDYQSENSIVYNDIVYIHDVKEIYTHGRFYNEYATFDYTEFEDDDDVYVSEYIRQTLTIASIINNYGIVPVQIKNGESFLGIGVATIYIDTKSTVKNILCETVWLDNWTDSENQKHVIFKAEYNEDSEVRYELIQKDYVFANHKTSHLITQELTVNDQKLQLDGSIDTYVKGNGTLGKINEFLARDDVAKFANDLTGRNEATAEEFTLRPSAGNISIRDDSATIKRIKGNSIVWNQMLKNGDFATTTDWSPYQPANVSLNWGDGLTVTSNYAGTGGDPISVRQAIAQPFILGHRYFVHFEFSTSNSSLTPLLECYNALYSNEKKLDYVQSGNHYYSINNVKATCTTDCYLKAVGTKAVGDTWTFKNVMIIDLTQMFGAGNEPDTVEEFKALFPDNYYEYNPGQLVSMTANGLFTNGFNQWNGNATTGYINDKTGTVIANQDSLCTDFIRVIPNQKYYINTEQTRGRWGAWYDANKNYIAGILNYDQVYTAPTNAAYVRLTIKRADSGNPDTFCLNLSHTGVENGKYEPYWDATKDLSIIQKYFPNGMRSAGSIYDEISFDETIQKWVAIRRVGNVDLGSLSWAYSEHLFGGETVAGFKTSIEDIIFANTATTLPNITVSKYNINTADKVANGYAATETFTGYKAYKTDLSAYFTFTTDASEFKSSLLGVMLNYELAESIITVIEEPINLSYKVGDFGIEQILSDSFSAPFRADIIYQFNATDRIRENSLNIEKLSKTQNECLLLAGGTMSGQINSQDIKPVEDSTYQLGDSTHKYKNVFSDFFTGNLEGNAKTASDLTGRVEATPEVFTYRPSAGEKSIKDNNAFIRRIKGNSVVWNNKVQLTNTATSSGGITVTVDSDGLLLNGTATENAIIRLVDISYYNYIGGHKYFLSYHTTGYNSGQVRFVDYSLSMYAEYNATSVIFDVSQTAICNLLMIVTAGTTLENYRISGVILTDLTQMFGAGNEPTTVEEFRALYPDSYYPYNTGELRNLDCSGIKTIGFNQWDEQWERGTINSVGENDDTSTTIRSKNYNPVIGGADYYVGIASEGYDNIYYLGISWYDSNKQFISKTYCNQRVITSPINAAYFKIFTNTNSYVYGTTYNNDICINLHHTGWRDGEYESYKEVTHSLPLSQVTNGEPLRKAGSVYDEINETHYIKRVGVVDLGSLNWSIYTPRSDVYFADIPALGFAKDWISIANLFSTKFTPAWLQDVLNDAEQNNIYSSHPNYNTLYVRASGYDNEHSFKSAMSGVLLNYELAEPIVTPITTPIDFNYYVEDFGTEEALLTEDSAPFSADIVYQFNATDQIRNNTRNIDKMQKSAFTPRGTSAQYIRGDGSYGNVLEFTQAIPINDGEYEMPDAIHQFILTPNYYAKSPVELDNTTAVTVYVIPPEDSNYLAEYWFEFKTGEVIPDITFISSTEDTKFRIAGDMLDDAVNILHLISSDGGMTFFGEMKHYIL